MRLLLTSIVTISFAACGLITKPETSKHDNQQPETEDKVRADADEDSFAALVEKLKKSEDHESAEEIINGLARFIKDDRLAETKAGLAKDSLRLSEVLEVIEGKRAELSGEPAEAASTESSEDSRFDGVIAVLSELIAIVTEIVENTVVIGGMGCGTIAVDAANPPQVGSGKCDEVSRIARCVLRKCVDPFEKIFCEDLPRAEQDKIPVCKINAPPQNDTYSLCGVRTGMCKKSDQSVDDVLDAIIDEALQDLEGDDEEPDGLQPAGAL